MEFLGKLGIDTHLLLAQIVNFLILLWFLDKFLYRAILKRLKERRDKIKAIEEKEKEIERKKLEIEKQQKEIIQKAKEKTREILEESEEVSQKEKERIIKRAEEEVKLILEEARKKAALEVEKIKGREKNLIRERAASVLKEVLSQSITKSLHQKLFQESLDELKKLDFKKIREKGIIQVLVVTAFPMSKKEERIISQFLFSKLKNPAFQEKVDPNLLGGVKIVLGDFLIDNTLLAKIEKAIS